MRARNAKELLQNSQTPSLRKIRQVVLEMVESAIKSVDPFLATQRWLGVENGKLSIGGYQFDLPWYASRGGVLFFIRQVITLKQLSRGGKQLKTHTGFWEYLIALSFRKEGKEKFTPPEIESRLRDLEERCHLTGVDRLTIYEQLTQRCCSQGPIKFGSLLNYFHPNPDGSYSLFDPEKHEPTPERKHAPLVPTDMIIKHIKKSHLGELKCVLAALNLMERDIPNF